MDRHKLEALLHGGVPLVYERETVSTNDDAKRLVGEGKAPILVVAERQSGGRGRRGNAFSSPVGGIYMSLAIALRDVAVKLTLVTSLAAVAVCDALREAYGLDAAIKWVNDIYVDGRKLAGILVELVDDVEGIQHIVIGIGINGHTTPIIDDSIPVTSLSEHACSVDLEATCASVAQRLMGALSGDMGQAEIIACCRQRSVLLGQEIGYVVDGLAQRARALDIDDEGALVVAGEDGVTRLTSVAHDVRLLT